MVNENLVKKLIYQSNYRGSRENDKLLSLFAKKHLTQYDSKQLHIFQDFIQENEQDIFHWLNQKAKLPLKYQVAIINHLFQFIQLRNFD